MARKSKKTKNINGAPAPQQAAQISEKKKSVKSIVFNIMYYGVLFLLVIAIFLLSNISGGSQVRTYGGYAAFTVLSGSMQSEIPKDSLVITKNIDARELRIGDDITYIANETTVVTHRIIEIIENGNGKGGRAFRTKGVNNPNPDGYQVYEENVIGKVIYHNYYIGRALIFISKQWPIVLFLLAVFAGLGVVLNKILKDDNQDDDHLREQILPMQTVQTTQTVQPVQHTDQYSIPAACPKRSRDHRSRPADCSNKNNTTESRQAGPCQGTDRDSGHIFKRKTCCDPGTGRTGNTRGKKQIIVITHNYSLNNLPILNYTDMQPRRDIQEGGDYMKKTQEMTNRYFSGDK